MTIEEFESYCKACELLNTIDDAMDWFWSSFSRSGGDGRYDN